MTINYQTENSGEEKNCIIIKKKILSQILNIYIFLLLNIIIINVEYSLEWDISNTNILFPLTNNYRLL